MRWLICSNYLNQNPTDILARRSYQPIFDVLIIGWYANWNFSMEGNTR